MNKHTLESPLGEVYPWLIFLKIKKFPCFLVYINTNNQNGFMKGTFKKELM